MAVCSGVHGLGAFGLDLADRIDNCIEGQHRRGMACLVFFDRDAGSASPRSGPRGPSPSAFSIASMSSRALRNSCVVAPTTWLAMIEDEAWPRAQALTSWAKAETVSPSIFSQILTLEPQSFECAWALASESAMCRSAEYYRQIREFCCCRCRPSGIPLHI
jgi:hypothetical protein